MSNMHMDVCTDIRSAFILQKCAEQSNQGQQYPMLHSLCPVGQFRTSTNHKLVLWQQYSVHRGAWLGTSLTQ